MDSHFNIANEKWEDLGVIINFKSIPIKRNVLFEKTYSESKLKQIKMTNFFINKISGCKLFINTSCPETIFFIKNDEILIEKDEEEKKLYFTNINFWNVFEREYLLNFMEIISFLDKMFKSVCYERHGDIIPIVSINMFETVGYKIWCL